MKKLKKILKRVENKMSKKPAERDYNWRATYLEIELKKQIEKVQFLKDFIFEREELVEDLNNELISLIPTQERDKNSIISSKVKNGLVQSKVGYNKETVYLFKAAYVDEQAQTGVMFVVELPGSGNPECYDSGFFRSEWI